MPSLGPLEILVILVVALLLFGPDKLPDLARQVGKGMAEFRRVQHSLRRELDDAIHSVMDEDKADAEPTTAPMDPSRPLDTASTPAIPGPPLAAEQPPPPPAPALPTVDPSAPDPPAPDPPAAPEQAAPGGRPPVDDAS